MRYRPSRSLVRRSWWGVFGLFIATPAVVLAVLGLRAIRADEIERQQHLAQQQAQVANLADAALATTLDRLVTDARSQGRAAIDRCHLNLRGGGRRAGPET